MLNILEVAKAIGMVEQLRGRYEGNPTNIVCDLLTLIARAAHLHGVPLQPMLDAVRRGATTPKR